MRICRRAIKNTKACTNVSRGSLALAADIVTRDTAREFLMTYRLPYPPTDHASCMPYLPCLYFVIGCRTAPTFVELERIPASNSVGCGHRCRKLLRPPRRSGVAHAAKAAERLGEHRHINTSARKQIQRPTKRKPLTRHKVRR